VDASAGKQANPASSNSRARVLFKGTPSSGEMTIRRWKLFKAIFGSVLLGRRLGQARLIPLFTDGLLHHSPGYGRKVVVLAGAGWRGYSILFTNRFMSKTELPDRASIELAMLELFADGQIHHDEEIVSSLVKRFELDDQILPLGMDALRR
jgi:hypothetical protein